MVASMHPDQLWQVLTDGREFALLDVRERGQYARAHLFLAINLPLSHLELRMRRYVPRLTARVLLCDDENGFAERAAKIMEMAGYTDVSIIEGSVHNCAKAGFELFRGHYAVTYAFGLYVGQHYSTPEISARSLKAMVDANQPLVILDSRSIDEYRGGSIPGAVNVPLAELPYRICDLAPDADTRIVVTCGAVTRGVLGCQSLLDAGVANQVSVLRNGVRGWDLGGFELTPGMSQPVEPVSLESAMWSAEVARGLGEAEGVQFITREELEQWREDAGRTLYMVDVRTREEYQAGHLYDAVWIPGGELIGLYEDHIGILNARFCLVDDNGARAILTATWLKRMGWSDVAVLDGGVGEQNLVTGPQVNVVPEIEQAHIESLSPAALAAQLESGNVLVLDFASSSAYWQGHIPGAWWALRSNLPDVVHKLPDADSLVTTCPDGRLATLAAKDLCTLSDLPISVVARGTGAWRDSGGELVTGLTRTLGEVDDVSAEFAMRPNDDRITVLAAQRRMLRWQNGLLEKLDRDRSFAFPELPELVSESVHDRKLVP